MSLSTPTIEPVRVAVPAIDIQNKHAYAVLKGPTNVSWVPNVATSYSTSSLTFTCPPPNARVIIDRTVLLEMQFQINCTATGTVATAGQRPIQLGLYDAPRQFPLSSIITTSQATINNAAVSCNMGDVVQPMMQYWTSKKLKNSLLSMTPSMSDQYLNYSDFTTFGSARNPLGMYGEDSSEVPRGGFPQVTVAANTALVAAVAINPVITMTVTEPVMLSPYCWGTPNQAGFYGVSTMSMVFTLGNLLTRLWSRVAAAAHPGGALTIDSVTLPAAPRLLFRYYTPDPIVELPKQVIQNYFDIQRYITTGISVAAGAVGAQLTANSIQLSCIPNRLYVWLRRRDADRTITTADSYAYITNLNVNWNNHSGLLSSATPQDLYNISQRNGCEMSWPQWSRHLGSIIAIDFPADIGLGPIEAPGMLGTYQMQIAVTYNNPDPDNAVQFDLYIAAISEGIFISEDGRSSTRIGILAPTDIMNAKETSLSYQHVQRIYGGSFFGNIGKWFSGAFKKVKAFAKDAVPIARKVIDAAKEIPGLSGFAKPAMSIVETVDRVAKALPDGAGRRRKVASRLASDSGGKRITAAQLKQLMHSME